MWNLERYIILLLIHIQSAWNIFDIFQVLIEIIQYVQYINIFETMIANQKYLEITNALLLR